MCLAKDVLPLAREGGLKMVMNVELMTVKLEASVPGDMPSHIFTTFPT